VSTIYHIPLSIFSIHNAQEASVTSIDTIPWVKCLSDIIQDIYKNDITKLVGLCFGHQIVGHALGGHVRRNEKGLEMVRAIAM
jgi:GMP synthase-like glutamine amidotransferase